ncbi:MAG: hypothetical protein U1A22_04205 [Xanthomonadaceae bacterium]|nr:hypothetical protein [Xanthomonadaceae bacterium]
MNAPGGLPFPIWLLALDGFAVVLLALGLIGLIAAPAGPLAVLATPALAWALVAVGGGLMSVALVLMLLFIRQSASRRR